MSACTHANVAARLSQLAYEREVARLDQKHAHAAGEANLKLISNDATNTRVLVRWSRHENVIFVAVKGTEFGSTGGLERDDQVGDATELMRVTKTVGAEAGGLRDLITDAKFWMTPLQNAHCNDAKVHTGFLEAARSVQDEVFAFVGEILRDGRQQTIVFTGHSLGAAISTILATGAYYQFSGAVESQLITFGSPHVGNASFADLVTRCVPVVMRYCCIGDVIPMLLAVCGDYTHVGSATTLHVSVGRGLLDITPLLLDVCSLFNKRDAGVLLKLQGGGVEVFKTLWKMHSMDTYYKLVTGAGIVSNKPLALAEYFIDRAGQAVEATTKRVVKGAVAGGMEALVLAGGAAANPALGVAGALVGCANLYVSYQNQKLLHQVCGDVMEVRKGQEILKRVVDAGIESVRQDLNKLGLQLQQTEEYLEARITKGTETLQNDIARARLETLNMLETMGFQAQERHDELVWLLQTSHQTLDARIEHLSMRQDALFVDLAEHLNQATGQLNSVIEKNFEAMGRQTQLIQKHLQIQNVQTAQVLVEEKKAELTAIGEELGYVARNLIPTRPRDAEDALMRVTKDLAKVMDTCLNHAKVSLKLLTNGTGGAIQLWQAERMLILLARALEIFCALPANDYLASLNSPAESYLADLMQHTGCLLLLYGGSGSAVPESLIGLSAFIRSLLFHDGTGRECKQFVHSLLTAAAHGEVPLEQSLYHAAALEPHNTMVWVVRTVVQPYHVVLNEDFIRFETFTAAEQINVLLRVAQQQTGEEMLPEAQLLWTIACSFCDARLSWLAADRLLSAMDATGTVSTETIVCTLLTVVEMLERHSRDAVRGSVKDVVSVSCLALDMVARECTVCDRGRIPRLVLKEWTFGDASRVATFFICELLATEASGDGAGHNVCYHSAQLLVGAMLQVPNHLPLALYSALELHHNSRKGLACGVQLASARQVVVHSALTALQSRLQLSLRQLQRVLAAKDAHAAEGRRCQTATFQVYWEEDGVLRELEIVKDTDQDRTAVSLPEEIGALVFLESMSLRGLAISTLPSSLARLRHLATLDVSDNWLSELPEELSQLRYLKKLVLSRNRFKELPTTPLGMVGLEELHVDHNQITQLPEDWKRSSRIRLLDISNNEIRDIPPGVLGWASVDRVLLAGNPLTDAARTRLERHHAFQCNM